MDCWLSPSESNRQAVENEKLGFVYELMVCMHVSVVCVCERDREGGNIDVAGNNLRFCFSEGG